MSMYGRVDERANAALKVADVMFLSCVGTRKLNLQFLEGSQAGVSGAMVVSQPFLFQSIVKTGVRECSNVNRRGRSMVRFKLKI